MFDEKGFEIFVGHASGASYTSGLTNIEKTYGVNIDNEYAGDKCAHLCTIMDADKKALSGNDLKTRQNWYSHLKKYIAYQECVQAIDFILTHYKAEFPKHHPEEQYKWEAVLWYKNHWNIDAPDFAAMFKEAFSKAGNLLDSSRYSIPYTQACELAEQNPEAVRQAFRTLYDETLPLETRINEFKKVFSDWLDEVRAKSDNPTQNLSNYQDLHTVSVYLSFEYPEEYYIYKAACYLNLTKRIQFEGTSSATGNIKKLENLNQLCTLLLKQIHKDKELLALHDSRLDSNCYRDVNLHLLVTDIVFYGSVYMPEHLFNDEDTFWPPLSVYNPGITKDMWTLILQDDAVTTTDVMQLLQLFLKLGGECTFQDVTAHLGEDFDYKQILQEFATAVTQKTNCPPCPKDYKDFEKYIIPFVVHMVMTGKKKQESWRLRDELKAALDELNGFWPSLAEYDPKLTKEDWQKYILEVELPNHPQPMQMLKVLMEQNGQASCKRLSELYGGTPSRYVGCAVNLGKRAKKYFKLPACMDEGQERFFAIPFVGKRMLEGDKEYYVYRMRPELFAALKEIDLSGVSLYVTEEEETMETVTDIGLNTILYGPPGTGKTYHTVIYAVAIIENKKLETVEQEAAKSYQAVLDRYNEYKAQRRIEFTTFHQSYGYEEFIEGIRPSVNNEDAEENAGNIQYSIQPGMFKKFCERADNATAVRKGLSDLGITENATVWKVSLMQAGDNEVRKECFENDHIRIGWDDYGADITDETDFIHGGKSIVNAFINKMQIGDIVLSCYSASTFDAIGIVTGDYEWHEEFESHCRVRKVTWVAKNIREYIKPINNGKLMVQPAVYQLSDVSIRDVQAVIEKYLPTEQAAPVQKTNYVFIIDEINRGNISKIFGELITLIEDTKRVGMPEGMTALLPYSMNTFGVPDNVYIVGTMNTADRSIATIDTALRRRFQFKEMLPDEKVVAGISVDTLSIGNMLKIMNQRVAVLYDREHTIGHAYFMKLKEDNRMEVLADIFMNKIIPLLQEYFYEDYDKIRLVLGDNQKKDETTQFIQRNPIQQNDLFGNAEMDLDGLCTYTINDAAFMNPEAYRYL